MFRIAILWRIKTKLVNKRKIIEYTFDFCITYLGWLNVLKFAALTAGFPDLIQLD